MSVFDAQLANSTSIALINGDPDADAKADADTEADADAEANAEADAEADATVDDSDSSITNANNEQSLQQLLEDCESNSQKQQHIKTLLKLTTIDCGKEGSFQLPTAMLEIRDADTLSTFIINQLRNFDHLPISTKQSRIIAKNILFITDERKSTPTDKPVDIETQSVPLVESSSNQPMPNVNQPIASGVSVSEISPSLESNSTASEVIESAPSDLASTPGSIVVRSLSSASASTLASSTIEISTASRLFTVVSELKHQWELNLNHFAGHLNLIKYASYVHMLLMIYQISRLSADVIPLLPEYQSGYNAIETAVQCAIAWGMKFHNRSAEKAHNISAFKLEAKKYFALISYLNNHPWELFFYITSRIPHTLVRELPTKNASSEQIAKTLQDKNLILTLLKDSQTNGSLTPALASRHVNLVFSIDKPIKTAVQLSPTILEPRELRPRKSLSVESIGFSTPNKNLSKSFNQFTRNNSIADRSVSANNPKILNALDNNNDATDSENPCGIQGSLQKYYQPSSDSDQEEQEEEEPEIVKESKRTIKIANKQSSQSNTSKSSIRAKKHSKDAAAIHANQAVNDNGNRNSDGHSNRNNRSAARNSNVRANLPVSVPATKSKSKPSSSKISAITELTDSEQSTTDEEHENASAGGDSAESDDNEMNGQDAVSDADADHDAATDANADPVEASGIDQQQLNLIATDKSSLLMEFNQILAEIKQLMLLMQSTEPQLPPSNDHSDNSATINSGFSEGQVCSSIRHYRFCIHHRDAQQRAIAAFENLAINEPRIFYTLLQQYYTEWSDRAQVHLYLHQLICDYSIFFPVLAPIQIHTLTEYQLAIQHYLMQPHDPLQSIGAAFIRPSYLRNHPEYLRQLPAWNAPVNGSVQSSPTKFWIYCPDWIIEERRNTNLNESSIAGQLDPKDPSKFTSSAFLRLSKAAFPGVDFDGTTGFPMIPLKLLLQCGIVMVLYPQQVLDTMCIGASIGQEQLHCVITETQQPLVSGSCNVHSIPHACERIIEQLQIPEEGKFHTLIAQAGLQKYLRSDAQNYPQYRDQCTKDKQKRLVYQQQRESYSIIEFDKIAHPLLNAGMMTESQIKSLYPQLAKLPIEQLPCLVSDKPESWLNDNHINVCLKHSVQLQLEAEHPSFGIEISEVLNPQYILEHCSKSVPEAWLKNLQLSTTIESTNPSNIMVLPMCINKSHYVIILADKHYQTPRLYLFNPLGQLFPSEDKDKSDENHSFSEAWKALRSALPNYQLISSEKQYQQDAFNCGVWIIHFVELYVSWKLNHPFDVLEDISSIFPSVVDINATRQRYCVITQRHLPSHLTANSDNHSDSASNPSINTGSSLDSNSAVSSTSDGSRSNPIVIHHANPGSARNSRNSANVISVVSPLELEFEKDFTVNVPEQNRDDRLRRAAWSIDTIYIENNLMAIDKELNRYRALEIQPPQSYFTHLNTIGGHLWQKYQSEKQLEQSSKNSINNHTDNWHKLWTAAGALAQKCTILNHIASSNNSVHHCSAQFGCWHTLANYSTNAHSFVDHNSIIRAPLSIRITPSAKICRLTGTLAEHIKIAVQSNKVELELNHTATGDHTMVLNNSNELTSEDYIRQLQKAELPKEEYSFHGNNLSNYNYQEQIEKRDCSLYLADITSTSMLDKQLWNSQFAQFVGRSTAAGLLNHFVVNKTSGVQELAYYYSIPGPQISPAGINHHAHFTEPHCESGHLASVHTFLHTDSKFGDIWSHSHRILAVGAKVVAAHTISNQKWIYGQIVSLNDQCDDLIYTVRDLNTTSDLYQLSSRLIIPVLKLETYPVASRSLFGPGHPVLVLQSSDNTPPVTQVQEATVVEYHSDTAMYSVKFISEPEKIYKIRMDHVLPVPRTDNLTSTDTLMINGDSENSEIIPPIPHSPINSTTDTLSCSDSATPKPRGRPKKIKVDPQQDNNNDQVSSDTSNPDKSKEIEAVPHDISNKSSRRQRSPSPPVSKSPTRPVRLKRKL